MKYFKNKGIYSKIIADFDETDFIPDTFNNVHEFVKMSVEMALHGINLKSISLCELTFNHFSQNLEKWHPWLTNDVNNNLEQGKIQIATQQGMVVINNLFKFPTMADEAYNSKTEIVLMTEEEEKQNPELVKLHELMGVKIFRTPLLIGEVSGISCVCRGGTHDKNCILKTPFMP